MDTRFLIHMSLDQPYAHRAASKGHKSSIALHTGLSGLTVPHLQNFVSPSDSIANLAALWSLSLDFMWYPHRRLPRRRRRRSGHRSYRGQSNRRYVGHAARWTAVARYQAVDSKRQRPGPVRLGYHRAICTGNRSQATADAGSHLWRD